MTRVARDELSAIAPLADRQMRQWAMAVQAGGPRRRDAAGTAGDVHPYVAISREVGAGGEEVARLVAQRLGCECFDSRLLTCIAERHGLPEHLLRLVDETVSDWLRDTLRLWLDRRAITQDDYVMRLGSILILAAHQGSAVFVGRGAQFVLPRERGLAVRIVAPLERRIARTMEERNLGRDQAAAYVRETDEGRSSLVRRYFHEDVTAPRLYDLVVNLEHLDAGTAADAIAATFRRRFGIEAPRSVAG